MRREDVKKIENIVPFEIDSVTSSLNIHTGEIVDDYDVKIELTPEVIERLTTSPPEEWLSETEVAELTGMKKRTLTNWRSAEKRTGKKSNELEYINIGNGKRPTVRYSRESVERFLENRKKPGGKKRAKKSAEEEILELFVLVMT